MKPMGLMNSMSRVGQMKGVGASSSLMDGMKLKVNQKERDNKTRRRKEKFCCVLP